VDDLKLTVAEAAELAQLLAWAISFGDDTTRARAGRWIGVLVNYGDENPSEV
jgi:hypothetical protein